MPISWDKKINSVYITGWRENTSTLNITLKKVIWVVSNSLLTCIISTEAVQHAKDVLERVEKGIQVTNIETYIQQSQQILDEIMDRNFTDNFNRTDDEHRAALECKNLFR